MKIYIDNELSGYTIREIELKFFNDNYTNFFLPIADWGVTMAVFVQAGNNCNSFFFNVGRR